jgi:KAP family P-loop domain
MTTSAETAKAEIARFLKGTEPGVLCITGEWGVGKTFLWRLVLDHLRKTNGLSITRYSYVSLFGLNSLDDVKSALFENMEWLDQDATSFAQQGKAGAKALAARAKKLSELAGTLPWVGQALTKARSLYFSLIQNQIVCIDDLERRSKNLDLKDVLGLISFLREQRGCKVAIILNAEKLGDKKDDFDTLMEKVIEEKVIVAPTATESAAIALEGKNDALTSKINANSETLGIRNIRVIKQIERLVRRIDGLLIEFPQPIRDQAAHSVTLFGWSKYDGENSIKIEFLKVSSLERHLARRGENAPQPQEEASWESLLEKYKFGRSDDFDLSLMKYVDTMILDIDEIKSEARKLQEQQRIGGLQGRSRLRGGHSTTASMTMKTRWCRR